MDFSPEVIKASTALGSHVAKKSTTAIWDKIRAVKQKGEDKEIINSLEEIINDLISDKNDLIQIAQSYDDQLVTQKISDEDIEYITGKIIPIITEMLEGVDDESAAKLIDNIDTVKPLLSKETFNIMQLLGFNFKKALGEPLTELVRTSILSNKPIVGERLTELKILEEQKQVEYFKVLQNEDAFERHLKIINKED